MPHFDPETLKGIYDQYFDPAAKEQLVESCRRRVVRWRWATRLMSPAETFRRELHQKTSEARWLDAGERPEKYGYLHGLDSTGLIHVARWPWSSEGEYRDELASETYWLHAGQQVTLISFEGETDPTQRTPTLVAQFQLDGGRLAWRRTFSTGGASEVQYDWRDNRLVRCIDCFSSHPYYSPGFSSWEGTRDRSFVETTYAYDPDGQLAEVWEQYLEEDGQPCADLERTLKYRRPRRGETIPALSTAIQAMLLKQIPAAVRKARITSPVYCLLICFCEEDLAASWPPFLVLGAESERERIIRAGRDVKYFLWAPDEMRNRDANHEIGLADEELVGKCRLHAQLMSAENRWDAGKEILDSVSQQLNEYRWSDLVATTDDFIVAAVDNTGERDTLQDIRAVVPPARLAILQAKGLV